MPATLFTRREATMHYINVDDKSNSNGGACAVCCCAPIGMRPGERRLITLNYAPWTIPIMANGGPGLVQTPEFAVAEDAESCSTAVIDTFAPPSVDGAVFNVELTTPLNTAALLDLVSDVSPAGNTFIFELVPLSGPYNGVLTAMAADGAAWEYEPNTGFQGYDQFWVKITDAQGRILIRPINLVVGVASVLPPFGWGPNAVVGVQIERSTVQVNSQMQTLSFVAMLPPSNECDTIDGCKRYRLTIKAPARDCERLFTHLTCIDFSCAKC
jgi:hypothetical protein